MSTSEFKKALDQNARDAGGAASVRIIDIIFPKSQEEDWKWAKLKKNLSRATGRTAPWYRTGQELEDGSFLFTWNANWAKSASEEQMSKASAQAQKATRDFMANHLREGKKEEDIAASGLSGSDAPKDPRYQGYVGGHVQSQAYLQMLRKAVAEGYPAQKAAELARGLSHGFAKGEGPRGIKYRKGMIRTYKGTWGDNVKLVKKVSAQTGVDYELDREIMVPIPGTTNTHQLKNYESEAQDWLYNHLLDWHLTKVNTPSSLPLLSEIAEVVAARLLGKKDKVYKDTPKVTKKPRLTSTKRPLPVSKTKSRKQHLQKALLNPIALRNLINKKLPTTVMNNMGAPALENVSGRFASSARLVNVLQNQNPVLQYTYQKQPYQVFEGTEPWAAGGQRDPRDLIDRSIREIAAELMIGKFTTQRV